MKSCYGLACRQAGFTLIELLISIAIIGILTAFGTFAFQNAFGKARDAQRRNDLKQLQTALQAYFNDYGSYPLTTALYLGNQIPPISGCLPGGGGGALWCGENATLGNHKTDYILYLTPKYIRRLPNDPRAEKNNFNNNPTCNTTETGYRYNSDGTDYKLTAQCTPEQPLDNPKDLFYDPVRATYSWSLYTDGAKLW